MKELTKSICRWTLLLLSTLMLTHLNSYGQGDNEGLENQERPKPSNEADATDKVLLEFNMRSAPLKDWQVEGYAFGTQQPNPKERQKAALPSRNQSQYQKGKMISPEFTFDNNYLKIISSGVYHPKDIAVVLVVDGRDVRSCSPRTGMGFLGEGNKLDTAWFDLRPLMRKKGHLEIRDNHFNGYFTHVKIYKTNNVPETGVNLIEDTVSWAPDFFETMIQGDFLLMPVGQVEGTPLQTVKIEIGGKEKLVSDFPLAFGSIPVTGYLPVYDVSGYQGKPLKVSFNSFTEYGATEASVKFLVQDKIPGRAVSDKKPAFHIYARLGLLNDPNGLCYMNGVYHLFHQFNYNITACSWAHYISKDLMHWEERPTGIFPDEFGSMHSGSAAVDVLNTSGWQTGNIPPLVAAYTASQGMGGKDKIQMQGLAYSVDGGRTFVKFKGNPVLGESQKFVRNSDNARDPKIFWFSPTEGRDPQAEDGYWVMVLFENGGNTIYASQDMKEWERHGSIAGFHECPELFPLAIDGDPEKIRWVMYGGDGKYHIGEFNGKTFLPETGEKIPMYFGGRVYAAQTFNNTPKGFGGQPRRIQIGWQGGRRGQLSIANELTLRTTSLGLRLCLLPVEEIKKIYRNSENKDGISLGFNDDNPLKEMDSGLYDIDLVADLSKTDGLVLNIRGEILEVRVTDDGLVLGDMKIPGTKMLSLRIVADNTSLDIYFGKHGVYYSPRMKNLSSDKSLGIKVNRGNVTFKKLQVHELESIWK
ncbi:MAG: glycoside hydrolase family 32 protein [Bacteroidetes bacterium]|nr:glycoside hydrolase family 32 protein [Bacteroidota bacterium]